MSLSVLYRLMLCIVFCINLWSLSEKFLFCLSSLSACHWTHCEEAHSRENSRVVNIKKKLKKHYGAGGAFKCNKPIPANHQQDSYGNIGGGADFLFGFIFGSNVNGSDIMQDGIVHP